jgi:HlyD family secretion protein
VIFLKKYSLWLLLGPALIILLVWAFMPESIMVETAQVNKGEILATIDEDGEVRAHDRYVVAAPISGQLMRIVLEEGDSVSAGQALAKIAPIPLSVREREEQTARISAAEALAKEASERMHHAQTDLEQSKREHARVELLAKKGFISSQTAEQARIDETTKSNELEAARYRLQSATADVRAARAPLQVADAGTTIEVRAPVSGKVLRIVDKSERVVTAGSPLMTLGDPSKLEIVIDVLSADAVKIKPEMPVLLENWGGNQTLHARVRRIDPSAFTKISALGVEEQRVNIVADFVDPPGPLGDGYRVDGRIVVAEKQNVLKVPVSSLFRTGQGWSVFVVKNGRATRRDVDVGLRNATEAEVLRGLEAGNIVIRHPSNRLKEGARVKTQ